MAWLDEQFESGELDERLQWFCEPPMWRVDAEASRLVIEPAAESDFWQRTHYGFQADNGHILYADAPGSFVMETRVTFEPANQYDQAGLMVRLSADCWLKTSVEYEGTEPAKLGAVVTNSGWSDWSTQDVPASTRSAWFRLTRTGSEFLVEASLDGEAWTQLRLCRLHDVTDDAPVPAGVYACSPKGAGYKALFSFLRIEENAS